MRDLFKLIRTLHIYVSMFSLLLLLFFAITGFTLNHATWFGLDQPISKEIKGQMDVKLLSDPDKFTITEELRRQLSIPGLVSLYDVAEDSCTVDFKRPGGSAHVTINRTTGTFAATIDSYGSMAVLHDLHMGRDAGTGWSLVIDVAAWLMVFVSISGMILLFQLPKRKGLGLTFFTIGGMLSVAAYFVLVR